MKFYKVITKSGQKIPLESKEALDALVAAANSGARLVVTKHGVIDTSSIDSIVLHKELMAEYAERLKQLGDAETAKRDVLGDGVFTEEVKKLK